MMIELDSNLYNYGILPFLIFLARVMDVSLGTIRIIFVSRGNRFIAPLLGFFEILIWVLAVTNIIQNLDNWICYIAYALGFATGNYIGLIIEDKLSLGNIIFRIFTSENHKELMAQLNAAGFGTTGIQAEGSKQQVYIIYSIIKRNKSEELIQIINDTAPTAFYTAEDIRLASKELYSSANRAVSKIPLFVRWRKGK